MLKLNTKTSVIWQPIFCRRNQKVFRVVWKQLMIYCSIKKKKQKQFCVVLVCFLPEFNIIHMYTRIPIIFTNAKVDLKIIIPITILFNFIYFLFYLFNFKYFKTMLLIFTFFKISLTVLQTLVQYMYFSFLFSFHLKII